MGDDWGAGELARHGGTTVRTVQWYDRIGLLRASRDRAGRRRYRPEQLGRLQEIQLLVASGFALEQVRTILDSRRGRPRAAVYADQVQLLELQELRLRSQRAVLAAIAEVLEQHPRARVPHQVLTAVMDFDATLRAHGSSAGSTGHDTGEVDDEVVSATMALYFTWKAAAARALLLDANGLEPASAAGRQLRASYHQSLAGVLGDDPHGLIDLARAGEAEHAAWPAADRDLHRASLRYLA